MDHQHRRHPALTRAALLGACVLALLGCHVQASSRAPAAIALASRGNRFYVAEGERLWTMPLTGRARPQRTEAQSLVGPCERYVDLEVWQGELFALCDDGRVFGLREPDYWRRDAQETSTWRLFASVPVERAPLVALQRSDQILLAVAADGGMTPAVTQVDAEVSREHAATLDRFRGPDRGGPGELPVASFVEFESTAAHALVLRRGPELVASFEDRQFACTIPMRGAVISDIAVASLDQGVLALVLTPGGRARLVVAHPGLPPRSFAGVFELESGRRLPSAIRCRQL